MLLNTDLQIICIPFEERDKALKLLSKLLKAKKMTVHKLQRIAGLLNFWYKALFPARSFTRRYYLKTIGLKQYHHVRVDREMKDDTRMWMTFLSSGHHAIN